ncbi:hypothetical protein BKA69DRAFT_1122353 [Paraphysoderma sedebokerense]|nr:hypothetical protein BKA69DRAFT_1122353 [Paraphysoderma sedebokerense]
MAKVSKRPPWQRCCMCGTIFILLVAIGITIFFTVGVKTPVVTYVKSEPPANGITSSVTMDSLTAFRVNWDFLWQVRNDNFFPIRFSELTFNGFMDETRTTKISNGSLSDFSFQASNITMIRFPQTFLVNVNTSKSFISKVFQACRNNTASSTEISKIPIWYDLTFKFQLFQFIDYQATRQNKFDCECPVDLSSLNRLPSWMKFSSQVNTGH